MYQQELNSRALCENGELTWIGDQKEYLDEHLLEDAAPIYAMAQAGWRMRTAFILRASPWIFCSPLRTAEEYTAPM